ncbi:fibronectin type III domain-containing protein [Hyunsoonleella sp. SJ7]|uniref:Fibronectin type III domain-containing protein n=1 Tax=Hyunsoonleella aquatilis TaxID=2762758 RepID=A0A923HB81_9FLAO|nr:fibronectin type III domain-containing protein [Hyunsoonleella aquatilis]MBC3759289.1 fibronectin type III domain-containing protein [Hyunsoonleella aquatilis]
MRKKPSKFLKAPILLCFYFLISFQAINSQNVVWEKASPGKRVLSKNGATSEVYSLKQNAFEQKLTSISAYQPIMLGFPVDNGKLLEFRIKETNTMHPDLAEKFPDIKSYRGISTDGTNKSIAFTYSSKWGFKGVFESDLHEKREIRNLGSALYEFVVNSALNDDATFICEMEDYLRPNSFASGILDRDVDDGNLRRYRLALSVSGDYSQVFLDGSEVDDSERKAKVMQAMVNSVNRLNGIFERDFGITMQLIANSDALIFLNPSTDPFTSGISLRSQLVSTLNNELSDSDYDVGHLFHKETNRKYGNAGCIACVCTDGQKGQAYSVHGNPDTDDMNLLAAHEFGHQFGAYHTQSSRNCRSGLNSEVEPGSGSTIMSYAGICAPDVQPSSDDYFNYTSIRDVAIWTIDNSNCAELIPTNNNAPVVVEGADYVIPRSTAFVLEGSASDPDGNETLTYCWEQNDPEDPNSTVSPMSTNTFGPMFRSLPPTSDNKRYFPRLDDILANNLNTTWEVLPSVSRRLNFVLTVRDNDLIGGQVAADAIAVDVDANAGPFNVTSQADNTEVWTVGDAVTVTWDVAGTNLSPISTEQVEILLSIDGGATFSSSLLITDNDGEETFNLPDVEATSSARIMVKAVDNVYFAVNQEEFAILKSEYAILSGETHVDACNSEDAIFNLEYKTFLEFEEEVGISASNLPTGVNATFSVDTFSGTHLDGTPFIVTLSGLEGLDTGTYNFSVDGLSGTSNIVKNINLQFTIYTANTVAINLVSPINDATSEALEVDLIWDEDANSVSYQVQIATDDTFVDVIEDFVTNETTFQPSGLEGNQKYYWRVKSFNPCGSSDFSPAFNFSTRCIAPTDISLVSTEIESIEITWEDASSTSSWTVEYGLAGFTLGTGIVTQVNQKLFKAESLASGTKYDFYVSGDCSVGGSSTYLGPYSVYTKSDYCAGDLFYDSGGADGNYEDNESITTQIAPDNETDRVRVFFNTFDVHSGFDYLSVYSGEDNTGSFLGAFTGSELVGQEFVSTHDSGALTFVFTSNSFLNFSGWDATVFCEEKPNCFEPVDFTASEIKGDEASFVWTGVGDENSWELEYGLDGFSQGNGTKITVNEELVTISDLIPLTAYDIYIRTICDVGGFSETVGPLKITTTELCSTPSNLRITSFTNDTANAEWDNLNNDVSSWELEYGDFGFVQGTGTSQVVNETNVAITGLSSNTQYQVYVRASCEAEGDGFSDWIGPVDFTTSLDYCGGDRFYDSGGPNGNYANRENTLTTIHPNTLDERVRVMFNSFLVETCCDRLRIFDGPDAQSPLIGTYTTNPGTIVSSHESGALTFLFTSDGSVTRSGWEATVICESKPNCLAPTNFSYGNLEAKQVSLDWQQADSETSWTVEYGVAGFVLGEGNEVTSNTTSKILTELTPETSYEVYIKANCTEGGFSDIVGPLRFTTPVACFVPQNVNITAVSTTSADITWDNGTGNENEWEIAYGVRGFQLGNGTRLVVAENEETLEGLISNTEYDVYVRANCADDGYSDWSFVKTFKTDCESLLAPYTESFVTTNVIPDCWEQSSNGNWSFNTFASSGASNVQDRNPLRNSNYAWLDGSYSASNGDYILYSPWVDISSLTLPAVTFSAFSKNIINEVYNTLYVTLRDSNGVAFEDIIVVDGDTGIWKDFVIDLSTYALTSNEIQVAFKVRLNTQSSSKRYNDILVDEVSFDELPSCTNPINPVITNISGKSAEFSWEATDDETNWEIQYGFAGFTSGEALTVFTTTTTYEFSNLEPERAYDVYVRAVCDIGNASEFIGPVRFTTTELCPRTTNFNFVSSTTSTASLSWDDLPDTSGWEVEYHTNFFTPGIGTGTTQMSSTNSINLENLSPDTFYYAYLRRNCGEEDGYSDWMGYITFRTQISCFVPTGLRFTDVTKNRATILWDDNEDVEEWEVEYHTSFFSPGNGVGVTITSTTNTLDIENLTPSTLYYVFLRSNCGAEDGYSRWASYIAFRTPLSCAVPTGFVAKDITKNSAVLEWDNASDATEWEVEYHTSFFSPGNGVGATVTSATNSVLVENLSPFTNYYAYVRSNCGAEDGYSAWTGYIFFRTPLNCADPVGFVATDITKNSVMLQWENNSGAEEWEIEYNPGFFTPGIGVGTVITTTSTQQELQNLSPDTSYYAYIRSNCGVDDGFSNWIRYVFRTEISCNIPTGILISNITSSAATMEWANSSDANEWEIEYSTTAFSPGTGVGTQVTTTSNSLTIDNLQQDTRYYVYFRSYCGLDDGYSNWVGYYSFRTLVSCSAPTGFRLNSVTKNSASIEWNNSSDTSEWEIEYHTSFFSPGNGVGTVVSATSNVFTIENLSPDTLYYAYLRSNCGSGNGTSNWVGSVWFRTQESCARPNGFSVSSLTKNTATLQWDTDTNVNEWEIEYYPGFFSPGSGVGALSTAITNQIELQDLSSDTLYYAYVRGDCGTDDGYSEWAGYITFRTQVSCNIPTGFVVTNITQNTASLNWTNGADADEWEVEYNTAPFTPGIGAATSVSASSNTLLLESLTQDTPYYVYLRSNCGDEDGFSRWVGPISFRTLISCPAPTNFNVIGLTDNSASLTWDDDENAEGWEIEYSTAPFVPGNGTLVTSISNLVNLDNLDSSTTYYASLRKDCGEDDFSNWTQQISFTTLCDTGSDSDNLLVNGSFECGYLSPWTVSGTAAFSGCSYNFTVLNNSGSICSIVNEVVPTDGNYAAFTSFDGQAGYVYILEQRIDVPADIGSADGAILSFDFKVNYQMTYNNPTQERIFEARFTDLSGVQLFQVEEIRFGLDPAIGQIESSFSEDILASLNAYAGETIVLSFTAFVPESNTGPSKALVDNVSLIIEESLSSSQNGLGNKDLLVYPIPNNGEFIVENKAVGLIETIQVFDVSGRLIKDEKLKKPLRKANVSLQNADAGFYYVIVGIEGSKYTRRIIVD